jgi:hypothetical protein
VRDHARRADQVWSYDFTENATANGRKVRLFPILDENTLESRIDRLLTVFQPRGTSTAWNGC